MLQLTDAEKRDIVRYIEEGKELPEKYRFLLFENKRQVELLWNGKSDEVTNVVLPFQVIEQVDEPRSEKPMTMQEDLFDFSGRQIKGWTNKLIWGDNKYILSSLKNGPMRDEIEENGGIKLIYIDPPFDVGADFTMNIDIGNNTFKKEPNVLEQLAYRDTWGLGRDSFLSMLFERVKLFHDVLNEDGSIVIHCDFRFNHNIKAMLNEIFGIDNFINEIIWYYPDKFPSKSKVLQRNYDILLHFAKNKKRYNSNEILIKKDKPTKRALRKRVGGKTVDVRDENGDKIWVTYDEKKLDNVWRIPRTIQNPIYPTQKPNKLIENLIKMTTNKNDLVCDFFAGSGVLAEVSERMGRKWICSDLGKFSINTTRKRILSFQREKKKDSEDYRAFEILNLGKYQKQHFISDGKSIRDENRKEIEKKKEKEFEKLILNAFGAESVQGFTTFHGKKSFRMVSIGPINQPLSRLHVEEVIKECLKNQITKVDVLGFEYEMGLFPTIQEEARNKGIDLAYKQIPNEIFDKRAVEKGEVVFHDVAYIEIKPIVKGRMLSVELVDFCVFYNQDNVRSLEQSLKNNSSKIIVDNGQVVKVSKDKIGIVKKEQLTKKWEDWIDYWSVDYDFESKQEILRVEKKDGSGGYEEKWTGDYVFENEWQSFRTKENRKLDLVSAEKEINKSTIKLAVKVIDIFGNDTMKIVEVNI